MQLDELSYIKNNLKAAIARLRSSVYASATALTVEYAPESVPGQLWPPPAPKEPSLIAFQIRPSGDLICQVS